MCNTTVFQQSGFKPQQQPPPPFSLSTFQLLRSCNRLILSNSGQLLMPESQVYYNALSGSDSLMRPAVTYRHAVNHHNDYTLSDIVQPLSNSQATDQSSSQSQDINVLDDQENAEIARTKTPTNHSTKSINSGGHATFRSIGSGLGPALSPESTTSTLRASSKSSLPAFEYIAPVKHTAAFSVASFPPLDFNRIPAAAIFPGFMQRRSRGEKRTIPEEQKDEKYYERRKRNNEAAKKSRDARKIREDRNAFRAALLEQENSILRAQVMALRDELTTLKQLIATTTSNNLTRNVI